MTEHAPAETQDRPRRRFRLIQPHETRPNEQIGGGHFVFRRDAETGRVAVFGHPLEHPSYDAAIAECTRLAHANPGQTFVALSQYFETCLPVPDRAESL